MKSFHIVVAYDQKQGIGFKNKIPWKIKQDIAWFKHLTTNHLRKDNDPLNCVIMGMNTWRSIPEKFKPLSNRINLVLSRSKKKLEINKYNNFKQTPLLLFNNFLDALKYAEVEACNIFVIGGEILYREALKHPNLESIFSTEINATYKVDKKFPEFKSHFNSRKLLFNKKEAGLLLRGYRYGK